MLRLAWSWAKGQTYRMRGVHASLYLCTLKRPEGMLKVNSSPQLVQWIDVRSRSAWEGNRSPHAVSLRRLTGHRQCGTCHTGS